MNRLSEATGVHVSTISRIIKGQNPKGPTHQVLTVLAEALGLPPRTLGGWIGAGWAEHEPYEPPTVASFMTPDQRACVDQIIRAFATANRAHADAQQQMDELTAKMELAKPAHRAQSKKSG
ncbi:helix-turn-helix transcriptional regulator [uncultured Williamsia sp.]|uniref:helix-turn-helix domain-containing protein n=1 Tax=uncultured Williamsia sp. TaxID=259311 RepID=UPI00262670EB|nr:helix-turn-helix transcriptional regulator [uncultured Williamsia sp.]